MIFVVVKTKKTTAFKNKKGNLPHLENSPSVNDFSIY